VTTFYEVGAGKVLSGLARRMAPPATLGTHRTPEDINAFKASRNGEEVADVRPHRRTALVPGATGGIGGAIARALHGPWVDGGDIGTRIEMLDGLAGQLGGLRSCDAVQSRDKEDVENLVPAAEAAWGTSTSW